MELITSFEFQDKKLISARALHTFLGNKKQYMEWIKHRITKYGLIENQDYIILVNELGTGLHQKVQVNINELRKGTYTIEYGLTLEAAKELSMVEGNLKGKKARLYFIECEKKLHQAPEEMNADQLIFNAMKLLTTRVENQKLELEQKSFELEKANETIQEQAPKVEYVNKVLSATNQHTTTTIAKEMGITAEKLNRILYQKKIQFWHDGHWVLYQKYAHEGYTSTRTHAYTTPEGTQRTSILMVWTEKGRRFIHEAMSKELVH